MSTICNVCRLPITDATEAAKDRVYTIRSNGRTLPKQKKHDACDIAYTREKTGLRKVSDAPAPVSSRVPRSRIVVARSR